jgi:hypothetical protein
MKLTTPEPNLMKLPLRTSANYREQAVLLLDANEVRLSSAKYGAAGEEALVRIADAANTQQHSLDDVKAAVTKAGCLWMPGETA